MAKQRYVNTKLWSDSWIRSVNPLDRYLFLYFLTNEKTNLCGIYELPLDIISSETGIKENDLKSSFFPRLKPKVFFFKDYIILPNSPKHQTLTNPKITLAIQRELDKLPKEIYEKAISYGYPIHRVSHRDIDRDIDLEKDIDIKESAIPEDSPEVKILNKQIPEIIKAMESIDPKNKLYYGNKTQRGACEFLIQEYGFEEVIKAIEVLPIIKTKVAYCPSITTPIELRDKWVKIQDAILREKVNTKKNEPEVIFG